MNGDSTPPTTKNQVGPEIKYGHGPLYGVKVLDITRFWNGWGCIAVKHPPRLDTILPVGLQQFLRNLPLTTPRPSCAPGKRSYDTQDDMSDESEAGEVGPQNVCVESFMI